eukprot:UN23069
MLKLSKRYFAERAARGALSASGSLSGTLSPPQERYNPFPLYGGSSYCGDRNREGPSTRTNPYAGRTAPTSKNCSPTRETGFDQYFRGHNLRSHNLGSHLSPPMRARSVPVIAAATQSVLDLLEEIPSLTRKSIAETLVSKTIAQRAQRPQKMLKPNYEHRLSKKFVKHGVIGERERPEMNYSSIPRTRNPYRERSQVL